MQAEWYFDWPSPFSYLQLGNVRRWRERSRHHAGSHRVRRGPESCGHAWAGPRLPANVNVHLSHDRVRQAGTRWRRNCAFRHGASVQSADALRLCIAAGTTWDAIDTIYAYIWRDGKSGCSRPAIMAAVGASLGLDNVENAANAANVKTQLRTNTDGAIAAGVFGVPTLRVGGELF